MHLEIKAALSFITFHLYNKLPRRRVDQFGEELEQLLQKKYEGHWHPENPLQGSGYRCVHLGEIVDPIVELEARRSGLTVEDVQASIPAELNVWIDPFEVSYQLGEEGPVEAVYLKDSKGCSIAEMQNKSRSRLSPEAQAFVPTRSQNIFLFSPPPPSSDQSFSPTFTATTFAATKFGSTKVKKSSRKLSWGIVHPAK
ncbi:protein Tob2-like [Heteronotia binoei]|uniref:protein Tob2-like n=1 Tax=Heteronotia binoei TaxID=13085 RepID=UPI00292D5276|nr:protein Tob2-like [Heteronotia binoei]